MSYDTEKRKLNSSVQTTNQNINNTELLNKYDLTDKNDNVIKKCRTIQLIHNYNFVDAIENPKYPFDSRITILSGKEKKVLPEEKPLVILVKFKHFPERYITFTRLIPKIYIDDGQDINNQYIISRCNHIWNLNSSNVNLGDNVTLQTTAWNLRIEIFVAVSTGGIYLPTYLDLDLVLINENKWEEVNINKR